MSKEINDFLKILKAEFLDFHGEQRPQCVGVKRSYEDLAEGADRVLPEKGLTPESALNKLVEVVRPGLIGSVGPDYYGFVTGGATPVSIAADWLTSVWDQNAMVYLASPAASIIEDIVSEWILDLLELPEKSSVGFVSGAQMANFTALCAARNRVLMDHGWDCETMGLQSSPFINVLCADCCHNTVKSAVKMAGLGINNIIEVPTDNQGRIIVEELFNTIDRCQGPIIICLQAGNVNTGAFDRFNDILDYARTRKAWVHVDGAFGLWARATEKQCYLTDGLEKADSWAVDAHKWLNVPYDSGMVILRDSSALKGFKAGRCAYSGSSDSFRRDNNDFTPENSRRARGFVLYAALSALGREGVRNMIENSCAMATLFQLELEKNRRFKVINDVVLNQVLFTLEGGIAGKDQSIYSEAARLLQEEKNIWIATSLWKGTSFLRISISNFRTDRPAVLRAVKAINEVFDGLTEL